MNVGILSLSLSLYDDRPVFVFVPSANERENSAADVCPLLHGARTCISLYSLLVFRVKTDVYV